MRKVILKPGHIVLMEFFCYSFDDEQNDANSSITHNLVSL